MPTGRMSKEIRERIINLLISHENNTNAYDDDLPETFEHFKNDFYVLESIVNDYISKMEKNNSEVA